VIVKIVKDHPLINGNKRLGVLSYLFILLLNGTYLNLEDEDPEYIDLLIDRTIAIASFSYDKALEEMKYIEDNYFDFTGYAPDDVVRSLEIVYSRLEKE